MAALGTTLVGVGLAYRFRSARKERPLPVPPTLPSNVNQQVSGYTFTRSEEGRKIFTVQAARTMALKQGSTTVLEDVVVEVFGRKGDRTDVMRTQRAEYNSDSGDFSSPGKTEIELNAQPGLVPANSLHRPQSVYLETSGVSYRQQESLMVSDQLVRFRLGPTSGSAKGMKYATKDGWLELGKEVRADWHPPGRQPSAQLAATHLRYDKAARRVTLTGPLEVSRGANRVVSGSGAVALDSRNRLSRADFEAGVQASLKNGEGPDASSLTAQAERVHGDFDPVSAGLRTAVIEGGVKAEFRRSVGAGKPENVAGIEAQSAQVTFGGAHPEPQKGVASGNVRVTMVSRPLAAAGSRPDGAGTRAAREGSETKILTASEIDFSFRPGGRSLQEASSPGQGKLVLVPADPRQGRREITAGQMAMAFDAKDRLERLVGTSGTKIVQQPPEGTPPGLGKQESSSERLRATFDPATQAVQTLQQSGNFSLVDFDRRATAERADYAPQGQTLTLTRHPLVWDAVTRIKSERFLLHLDNDTAEGIGKVQATHFEGADAAASALDGKTGSASAPGSGRSAATATTNVLADRVFAERRDQRVHYEGHVRAWHGADVIESSSLDYIGKERRVSSGSSVLTSHLAAAADVPGTSSSPTPGSSRRGAHPLTIRADHLEFFDEGRKADYRGNVELHTESTTLRSDRMDVFFSSASAAGGSQVEHVVADGHVRVTQPQRRATGDHADYQAAPGKIVMQGGSPSLYDEEKGFTTGQSLTFFIRDDRLSVDGGEKSPTLSKHRVTQ